MTASAGAVGSSLVTALTSKDGVFLNSAQNLDVEVEKATVYRQPKPNCFGWTDQGRNRQKCRDAGMGDIAANLANTECAGGKCTAAQCCKPKDKPPPTQGGPPPCVTDYECRKWRNAFCVNKFCKRSSTGAPPCTADDECDKRAKGAKCVQGFCRKGAAGTLRTPDTTQCNAMQCITSLA